MKSKRRFLSVEVLAIILLVGMLILVGLQVVSRYIFNKPITWTEEMARLLLVWITFVGAYIALKRNQHVYFFYLLNKLPEGLKRAVSITIDIIVCVFFIGTIWAGFRLVNQTHSVRSVTLEFVRWSYVYAAVPIGFLMMLYGYIMRLKNHVSENNDN